MGVERTTLVDFVARTDSPEEWRMVLVEQGPWLSDENDELRRIQDRLYGCVDAVLDGKLAEQFPETLGKHIVIQLDCYGLPRVDVENFFKAFSNGVFSLPDYKKALMSSSFAKRISFEVNFQ